MNEDTKNAIIEALESETDHYLLLFVNDEKKVEWHTTSNKMTSSLQILNSMYRGVPEFKAMIDYIYEENKTFEK